MTRFLLRLISLTTRFFRSLAEPSPLARFLWITIAVAIGIGFVVVIPIKFQTFCTFEPFCRGVRDAATKSPPWTLLTSLAAAPALLLTWFWRTVQKDKDVAQKEHELAIGKREERSNRFFESIKLLADNHVQIQLGAIYSLESLATDAKEEQERICKYLMRTYSPKQSKVRKRTRFGHNYRRFFSCCWSYVGFKENL
jgi:hypothetical protein